MKIYVLVLMILLGSLFTITNQTQVGKIYTNRTKPIILTYNGEKYRCFDEYNDMILRAQLRMFSVMYLPVTNCVYSNMVENITVQSNLLASKSTREKIKDYTIIALLGYFVFDIIKGLITKTISN